MKIEFENNVSLKALSSFKIGGRARHLISVKNVGDISYIIRYCIDQNLKYIVIGNGSNVIFDDAGFDGVVIHNCIKDIVIDDNICSVSSGFFLPALAKHLASNNLSGMEFAAGIPGTVGGAVYMNAGAHGRSISDVIDEVSFVDCGGNEHCVKKDELEFGYRYSSFQDKNVIITSVKLSLKFSSKNLLDIQKKYLKQRLQSQPYNFPSVGSIFRNPTDDLPAWKLINECGLSGYSIGDAQVSEKHANFIINKGNAKAADVLKLIEFIKNEVYKKKGIILKEECRYVV